MSNRMGALKEYHKYFYDVTKGNNGAGVGNGYNAGPGWDIPSGWGTPNGAEIINWMIKVSPAVPPKEKTLGEKASRADVQQDCSGFAWTDLPLIEIKTEWFFPGGRVDFLRKSLSHKVFSLR